MRKSWTELELTIVYYIVKHGVHGAIRNRKTGTFLNEREVCFFLDHGQRSYLAAISKFKYVLGIPQFADPYVNATKTQKAIVEKYVNTTVSQLRLIIQAGLDELYSKSNNNTLGNKESSLERTETKPGDQLSFDFD
jgi:hypothetical protein